MNTESKEKKGSFLLKFAAFMERAGNKIPHPLYLFIYITIFIMVVSWIAARMGVSVEYISASRSGEGELVHSTVSVVNMLSIDGIVGILVNLWTNYATMDNVTLMLILGMGLALADHTGFFNTAIRKLLLRVPGWLVTYTLALVGICANICVDAGQILGASLGAIIYQSIGRNPWIGAITGYAAAAAGFTANVLPASLDGGLAAVTQQVVNQMGIPDVNVNILCNYIFMFVATFVLAAVITAVSELFLPRLFGDYDADQRKANSSSHTGIRLTQQEEKGLKYAAVAAVVLLGICLLGAVPSHGFFRNGEGKLLPSSPLMSSVVGIIFISFAALGIAYGVGCGKIQHKNDVPKLMAQGITDMAPICVSLFVVSMFLYVFNTSNLSVVVAVSGERFLRSIGLVGMPLLLVFIVIIVFVNLFMYSATAKWLILAPVFVPMFANLGVHPAMTQLVYRIGDSCSNCITPLNVCMVATISILNQYRDEKLNPEPAGVGTLMSGVLPFFIAMQLAFIALFVVFYVFNIPIGL